MVTQCQELVLPSYAVTGLVAALVSKISEDECFKREMTIQLLDFILNHGLCVQFYPSPSTGSPREVLASAIQCILAVGGESPNQWNGSFASG